MGKTVTTYLIDGDPKGAILVHQQQDLPDVCSAALQPVLPERTGEATEAGFLHIDRRG